MGIRDAQARIKAFARSKPTLPQDLSEWQDVHISQKTKNVWTIVVDTGETDAYFATFRKDQLSFKDLHDVRKDTGDYLGFEPEITIDSPGKGDGLAAPTTDVAAAMEKANKAIHDLGLDLMPTATPPGKATTGGRIARAIDKLVQWIRR